jgi:energy-coupling factor transporter transmembrane protein EcfT
MTPDRRLARPLAGRAFHHRDTGSRLHRLAGGWKLAGALAATAAAVAADGPLAQAALLAAVVGGYRAARLSTAELWQDARPLVFQGALVVGLYAVRDGAAGVAPGVGTAARLASFFLPGALLLRTTPSAQLLDALQRWLPARLSFALATSLRFVPYFARELHEIVLAQRLRGARLAPSALWHPGAWRDWIACVGVPLAVRAIHTAQEAALAAEARGLGAAEETT